MSAMIHNVICYNGEITYKILNVGGPNLAFLYLAASRDPPSPKTSVPRTFVRWKTKVPGEANNNVSRVMCCECRSQTGGGDHGE